MIKLQPDERIIRTIRRHWWVFVAEIFYLALAAALPFVVLPLMLALGWAVLSTSLVALYLIISILWFTALWLVIFTVWTNYYLDAWIITDQKIIDMEQRALFSREVAEYRHDRIQDVTVRVSGIIPTYLGFGNVDVQTAGANSQSFIIRDAPRPHEIKDLIMKLQHESRPRSESL